MTKHISCDYKCKLNSITCNSNQKWNNEFKNIVHAKKIIVGILAHVFVRMINIQNFNVHIVLPCQPIYLS